MESGPLKKSYSVGHRCKRGIPGSLSFSLGDRSRSSRSRWPTRWSGSHAHCWPGVGPTGRPNFVAVQQGARQWEDEVASVRSRTAGVMTTLMRNGRDRRLGKPVKCHARKERVFLVGTRSADHIRASGQSGCIQRPDTWLHPNASQKRQIPLAPRAPSIHGTFETCRLALGMSAYRCGEDRM